MGPDISISKPVFSLEVFTQRNISKTPELETYGERTALHTPGPIQAFSHKCLTKENLKAYNDFKRSTPVLFNASTHGKCSSQLWFKSSKHRRISTDTTHHHINTEQNPEIIIMEIHNRKMNMYKH